jgi:hypothetical protein
MLIAIDFDDTLTADSKLWGDFIRSAKTLGHRVICVTARRDTDDNNESVRDWMISHGIELPVYFTSLESKVEHAKKIGLKVDIWIDDDPRRCALGH